MERLRLREKHRHREEDGELDPAESLSLPDSGELPVGSAPNENVQVISGASVQNLPLAGLQISQARELVGTILRIDHDSTVLVNGEPVRPDHRLEAGDTIEFVHHAGEKGYGDFH